ncbi:hypothetical protein [Burkholderia ubonensis]|uniref:hypothetical protein n=1 Tax=Burkholderia ubonensis TaxID=101571 RepID=UPI00075D533D|nr:hypothetical protein [Burkholderia ubonensis]KWK76866.1 hypothetical protein WM15_28415 [Burkholderia ubonensis]
MIEFNSLSSLQRADASTRAQLLGEGCFKVGGREFLVQADQQSIRPAAAFRDGVATAFDTVGDDWLPRLRAELFPGTSALAGRLTAAEGQASVPAAIDLDALDLSLLHTTSRAFVSSTERTLGKISVDHPSRALQQVRDAFQALVADPIEANVTQLRDALDQWQLERPGEFAQRGTQVANLRQDMSSVMSHLQAERAKDSGVLGLSMPTAIVDAFADKIVFDGIGRVAGLKSPLEAGEVRQLIQQQTTPLTHLNAAGEREAPRTESESLIAFVGTLRRDGSYAANAVADRAQALWLNGQVNAQHSVALYEAAITQLRDQPPLSAMAQSLLVNANREKATGQYIDNLFGRYFDSQFAHGLIQHPTAAALDTSAQIGRFLVAEFDRWLANVAPDPTDREKRLATKLQAFANAIAKDTRPWFGQVPELTAFLADPTHERFEVVMSKVADGFDMIKVPYLAVKMATTSGMGLEMASWKTEGDRFYQQVITQARSTGTELSAGIDTPHKVSLKEQQTRGYGTLLPFQRGIQQDAPPDFVSGRDVTAGRILTPGKETPFERNAIAQGQTVVTGTSGSTNIMTHLNQHIASKLEHFSPAQAYLNTLAFLVFDGGHSVNESLAVYQALQAPNAQRAQVLQTYTANYQDIPAMLAESERAAVRQALNAAFDRTVELHRQLQQSKESAATTPAHASDEPPGPTPDSAAVEARARQLTQPLNQVACALHRIAADADARTPLQQLETMSQKNRHGQFELNQRVLSRMYYASSAWEQKLGVELNVGYLRLLQALIQDAGPLAADQAARLLRSPDHGKLSLGKLPGYYQAVLEHGRLHPELIDALKSLLDSIDRQASPTTVAGLTAKVQKQLERALQLGPAVARPPASLTDVHQQLDGICSRGLEAARRQATEEIRQHAHEQEQKRLLTALQERLTPHGLTVPSYMHGALSTRHLELVDAIRADLERQSEQVRDARDARINPSLEHVRSLAHGYRDSISVKQAELERLRRQADQGGKSALKQELSVAQQALKAVETEAARLAERGDRDLTDGISAVRCAARERLAAQMLAAGVYLENAQEEKAALQRCLQSDAAQRIVAKAVDEAKEFGGQVNKNKAIKLASQRLTEHVMNDSFFRTKMERIKRSFDNRANAQDEAGPLAASGQTLARAQAEASSQAKQQVLTTTQNEVKHQANIVAAELARKHAESAAREQAERVARKEAERTSRERAEQSAHKEAERVARQQAERAAREQAERAAQREAERAARERAEQSAKQAAERAAREQVEHQARARAEELWVRDFHRKLEPADTNLLHARLAMLKDEHEKIRIDNALATAPRVPKTELRTSSGVRQAVALDANGKPRIV